MPQTFTLESFDDTAQVTPGPHPDFEEGYQQGIAAAKAEAAARQDALSEQLVQAIADINFTYAEARAELEYSLRPLFSLVAEKIMPAAVEAAFPKRVVDAVTSAAHADLKNGLTLHVNPAQAELITRHVPPDEHSIKVVLTDDVAQNTAWIRSDTAETTLDAASLLDDLTGILDALQQHDERTATHG